MNSSLAAETRLGDIAREELPLLGKWFNETHHPELVEAEGRGEIS